MVNAPLVKDSNTKTLMHKEHVNILWHELWPTAVDWAAELQWDLKQQWSTQIFRYHFRGTCTLYTCFTFKRKKCSTFYSICYLQLLYILRFSSKNPVIGCIWFSSCRQESTCCPLGNWFFHSVSWVVKQLVYQWPRLSWLKASLKPEGPKCFSSVSLKKAGNDAPAAQE